MALSEGTRVGPCSSKPRPLNSIRRRRRRAGMSAPTASGSFWCEPFHQSDYSPTSISQTTVRPQSVRLQSDLNQSDYSPTSTSQTTVRLQSTDKPVTDVHVVL